MTDETKLVTLPSVLIVKPMESAKAKANADLAEKELTMAEAKALVQRETA